jgi:hypothetical protein
MYRASIKQILMTILASELLVKYVDIHAFDRFDADVKLSDEEFNRFLYFVEMTFGIELSNQPVYINSRFIDLVTVVYQLTTLEQRVLLTA